MSFPSWKPVGAAARWQTPIRASMIDIAPKLRAPAITTPTAAQNRGGTGAGMSKLFGEFCNAVAPLLGFGQQPQLAAEGPAIPQATVMQMSSTSRRRQGRRWAVHKKFSDMQPAELQKLIDTQTASIQEQLEGWSQQVESHYGNELWDEVGKPHRTDTPSTQEYWLHVGRAIRDVHVSDTDRNPRLSVEQEAILKAAEDMNLERTFELEELLRTYIVAGKIHVQCEGSFRDAIDIDEDNEVVPGYDDGDPQPLDFS